MPESLAEIRERLEECRIFVVPYCHPDWAWTHTRRWHELRYIQVFEDVLEILRQQDEAGIPADAPEAFRWYMDNYRMELAPFLEARPHCLPELRRRVAEGRIAVCGGYANVRVNHVHGETLVRSLVYGRREFRRLFPEAELTVHADLVDVAVGHPQLPQLLNLAGYRYFQFWRPHTALNEKGIPQQFVWEGFDGSQVVAARGCYSGLCQSAMVPDPLEPVWDETLSVWWEACLKERQERSPVGFLWAQHGADDSRPLRTHFFEDAPLDMPRFIAEWNRREDAPMQFATPVEVFHELDEVRDKLPVIAGTVDPCDVCYNAAWAGSSGLWRFRLDCAEALLTAEMLQAFSLSAGAPSASAIAAQDATEALWKDTLLFSAHAVQWLFSDDFDFVTDLARNVLLEARRLQRDALQRLTARVALPTNSIAVVFNPLPHERSAVVPLRITFPDGERGGVPDPLRLVDAVGDEIPYQVLGEMEHGRVRWEIDTLVRIRLPAGGWNVVCWSAEPPSGSGAPEPEEQAIENEHLRLEFHRGRLTRIREKGSGREWTTPDDTPFGHLREYQVDTTAHLHVGPILGRRDVCWDSWSVTEAGPVRWAFVSRGTIGADPVRLETRLCADEQRIECRLEIRRTAGDGFLAAHVPLPANGRLTGDMPFCVEPKDLANEPYVGIERQREGMFIAQSFVDWSDGDRGLAYISHDGDRYFVYDEAAGTLAHILVNSALRPRHNWEQHVNSAMEGGGTFSFSFSILPHDGDWREAELWRTAEGVRRPPLSCWPASTGDLPAACSLLSVEPANVTMSACYVEGTRLLVRLFENAGLPARATVTFPFEAGVVERVDLLGAPVADDCPVTTNGKEATLDLRPWQMVCLAATLPGRAPRNG